MAVYIHFHGFWSGFFEKTNSTHVGFYLQLFSEVYGCEAVYASVEDATVLVENTQIQSSLISVKQWAHTYLVSGESYIRGDLSNYTCVLYGSRNTGNIVNLPQYIPYIGSSFGETFIQTNACSTVNKVPMNDVLVVISNFSGTVRNAFCNELEKHMKVTYAGNYKNNIGGALKQYHNSKEFLEYVGTFKFIVAMENSEQDTYITEKIMHGILGHTIPVYWGSKRVTDYISSDRFLNVVDTASFSSIIATMKQMDDATWLRMVNAKPFTQIGQQYTIRQIARYIKNVIYPRTFPKVDHIYFLCNPAFEPERYDRLRTMCTTLGLQDYNVTFLSSTYKHTITDEMYKTYVTQDLVLRLRPKPMKKAEISLFINFKEMLEHSTIHFKDSIILTFESDVFHKSNYLELNTLLNTIHTKVWSCIHIGGEFSEIFYCHGIMPYRDASTKELRDMFHTNAKEDLTTFADPIRCFRKFNTRCTDSFVWTTAGCQQFLDYMNYELNYGAPFDYYVINKLETDMTFKHYHTDVTFFDQGSNLRLEHSTIQND